ncbi:hypothetical protein H4219_000762 [Mycoemilia scoparia]|uniref:Uncharacterized protein n=1 Tax=Mycoemilia scoparia TaxID=417184 RepID=A0A9W8DSK9_9FUNG|nr:hypothetical protein H4219_000762 [Mycoemilia scoparia]
MNINNTDIELELWDTAGQEDYDRLRHLSYADAQAVIICFGIDSPDSLENVAEKWAPEVSLYAPGVPVVLAALKHDLRANEATIRELEKDGQRPTTPEMGEAMCRNIQAQKYIECSAKTVFRVREVFDATAKLAFAMQKKNDSKSCCIIL